MTAVQEGFKITVIVSENHGYQCIRRLQMWRTGVSFGNEFRARSRGSDRLDGATVVVDYLANARSLGATVFSAHNAATLRRRDVLAALGVEPWSTGTVLPHERTMSAPKADRLELLRSLPQ